MPTKIEWCDEVINPLGWGCWGPRGTPQDPRRCSYCYAYRMARRKIRKCPNCQSFVPHWHPEQLEKPLHWKKPRLIFVQSMGDLLGEWVDSKLIEQVIATTQLAYQHTYLFLTKNPQRYSDFSFPKNAWLGASCIWGERVDIWLRRSRHMGIKFISFEPLLSDVSKIISLEGIDLAIIGGLSGSKPFYPPEEWIQKIEQMADKAGIPVFEKNNLRKVWRSIPRQEMP